MGGKAKTPDPVATSTAQAHANQTNATNPFLTSAWSQTGKNADGTPIMTATTQLSPTLQALYGQVGANNPNLSTESLGGAFDKSQGAAYDKMMSYYQPQFDVQNTQLEDQLAQQGINAKSDPSGYSTAHQLQSNQQAFQRQQAMDSSYAQGLNAEGQQFSQGVTQSNLPISQLSTLYGLGSGAGMGNSNTLSSLASSNYASNLASQNNTDSGLASLAAMLAMQYGSSSSDARVKRDIVKVGELAPGVGVYDFRYIWDEDDAPLRRGVMAQEVERVMPHAVMDTPRGKIVHYAELGLA
jgi:hypothetical protein